MNLPEFLTETPDSEILLTGHRIDLYHVVRCYNNGYSPEMLTAQYPTLPLSLIHKVIAFDAERHRLCRRRTGKLEQESAGDLGVKPAEYPF